jgi:insertion element IS1 protein InsB
MCYITIQVICPHCEHDKVKKNGKKPKTGKQNFLCHGCKKQFQYEYVYQGANPRNKLQVRAMAMRGSGIRDIHNVLKISIVTVISILRLWFQTHKEPEFKGTYRRVMIDEMWTFVKQRKKGKRWLWYAYCADTRKILAFQMGKRNDSTCKKLMKKLAHLDIKQFCTDDWKSYKKYIPKHKHIISKKATQKIERQNLNFRTHLKRLCRRTICFSKLDDMHYGFIKTYIHLKNAA